MTPPRTATLGTLAAILISGPGCLWRPKPYAVDPLVRGRRAVLTNADSVATPEPIPTPAPPLPPDGPEPPPAQPGR